MDLSRIIWPLPHNTRLLVSYHQCDVKGRPCCLLCFMLVLVYPGLGRGIAASLIWLSSSCHDQQSRELRSINTLELKCQEQFRKQQPEPIVLVYAFHLTRALKNEQVSYAGSFSSLQGSRSNNVYDERLGPSSRIVVIIFLIFEYVPSRT